MEKVIFKYLSTHIYKNVRINTEIIIKLQMQSRLIKLVLGEPIYIERERALI